MSRFSEISALFAALAIDLQCRDPITGAEVDASISDLHRSLNLCECSSVGVVDAALSLMCFTAPQVYDSTAEFTLKTIATILDSSIECKVLRINEDQVLRAGGIISESDCANIVEACADILTKLDGHKGDLCNSILYSVIRLAAVSSCFRQAMPSSSNVGMKFNDFRTSALAILLDHLPCEFEFGLRQVPLRVLLWHLDPLILKQDISQILQEITTRPFLSFSMEISNRTEWRSKLVCLAVSPLMFIETRTLLHDWFLMTGLASVMELQSNLAKEVLDVISRPTWWGLSMEVGLKFPFSQACFPHEHHLLRILSGPICHEYFQHLLDKISGLDSHDGGHLHTVSKEAVKDFTLIDHKSMWYILKSANQARYSVVFMYFNFFVLNFRALVISYPDWFFFATMLLFCNESPTESYFSGSIVPSAKPYRMNGTQVPCSTAAANFLVWFLNPIDASTQRIMDDYLIKVSELWNMKCSSSKECDKTMQADRNKINRFRVGDKNVTSSLEDNSWIIWSWIKEFISMYVKFLGKKLSSSTSTKKELLSHETMLLRRIPFGILLAHPNLVHEVGFSLILHYASTGTIHKCLDKPISGHFQIRWTYNWHGDSKIPTEKYTKSEAIAGCRAVLDIAEVAESISSYIFDIEEDGLDYVFQIKLRSCNYLLACIKRLLQIKQDEDVQMHRDLLKRVLKWRDQGKGAFPNNMDLDSICEALIG